MSDKKGRLEDTYNYTGKLYACGSESLLRS